MKKKSKSDFQRTIDLLDTLKVRYRIHEEDWSEGKVISMTKDDLGEHGCGVQFYFNKKDDKFYGYGTGW